MANRVINTILNLKDNFSKGLKNVSANTKQFQKQMKQVEMQGQQMRNSLSNAFTGISATVGVAGVASLGALATSSVSTYATFEQSMSKVQALSGATGADLQALSEKAQEMGRKTSKSSSECADALGYMALAGWDVNQMLTGLQPILRASEAGQMELATCSDLVTDSMSAMGIKVEDLSHYLDVVTKAQSSSNTSMEQLLQAYIGCGGTLKNLNVSIEESATVLGTLANRGKKSAEAGNALNSILVNLTGGSSTARGAMEELGVSAWDSQGNFIGLKNTLVKLKDALAKCTQEQKTNFESAIGGKTQMDTLQAMLSGVSEEYDELNAKIKDSKGYMEETAKIMQNNLKGALTSLKSAFEGLQIQVGKRFAPVLMKFMDWVTNSLPYWTSNINFFMDGIYYNCKKCAPVVAGVVSAFGLFLGLTAVLSIFNKLKLAIGGFNLLLFLTNPINLTCIAFGSLVAVIVHMMKTNDKFRENMINAWEYIKVKSQETLKAFWEWLEVVREKYGSLANFIMSHKTIIATIGGIVTAILAFKLLSPVSGIINVMGASFGKALLNMISFKGIASGLGKILLTIVHPIKTLKGGFALLGTGIKSLKTSFLLFKTFAPNLITGFITNFGKGAFTCKNLLSLLKGGFMGLKTALMGLFSPFTLVVAGIALLVAGLIYCWNTNEEFRNKLTSAWQQIQPIITGVITVVLGAIMGLATFLYNFYQEHKEQISTCVNSVLTIVGGVIVIIVDTITGLINIISGVFQAIDGLIHGDWDKMWEGCKNIVKGAIDMIKGWWDDLRNFFSKPIKAMINIFKKDSGTDSTGEVEQVDANATGTNYFGGGWTTVGEHGTELMKLPRGTQIKSNSESKKMMGGGGDVNVNLTIQGNVIGNEDFANYVGNYIWKQVKNTYNNM